ncbi:hypothetical protein ACJX0J_036261 [Zea mays]
MTDLQSCLARFQVSTINMRGIDVVAMLYIIAYDGCVDEYRGLLHRKCNILSIHISYPNLIYMIPNILFNIHVYELEEIPCYHRQNLLCYVTFNIRERIDVFLGTQINKHNSFRIFDRIAKLNIFEHRLGNLIL